MTISKSPNRLSFQKEKYIERCEKEGKLPSVAYLEMYEKDMLRYAARFDTEESRSYSMEYDLLTTDWILEKVRSNHLYAQHLYSAMCNNRFIKLEVIPLLTEREWSCSWRYSGGIIADMRQEGDYVDFYCSGIRDVTDPDMGTVPEGMITEEIREDLKRLGWTPAKGGDWEKFNDID